MTDWNGASYHQISAPQQTWGRRVLERIELEGDERVLDIGCGTGRVTAELAARVPGGRVVGVDQSPSMLETAGAWLHEHAPNASLVQADASSLPFRRAFQAVFSTATFHWVHDHAALFRSVIQALAPGGRLVAQCGGGPNLALLYARADRLIRDPRFAMYFDDWREPTYFADVESTKAHLSHSGFTDIEVWLEEAPTTFDSPELFREFIRSVCVREQVGRLSREDANAFLRELTVAAAGDTPPFTLDYWRLNMLARRPA
jgi:trans-aconitate 2-methyltransferase